jgi:hypothetical protein
MIGAISTVLLGSGSIVVLIRMIFVAGSELRQPAERRLRRKWLMACCVGLFLLLVVPSVLEIVGVLPLGSLGGAGAILFFLILVPSGRWYVRHLARLRTDNQFEESQGKNCQGCIASPTTHLRRN